MLIMYVCSRWCADADGEPHDIMTEHLKIIQVASCVTSSLPSATSVTTKLNEEAVKNAPQELNSKDNTQPGSQPTSGKQDLQTVVYPVVGQGGLPSSLISKSDFLNTEEDISIVVVCADTDTDTANGLETAVLSDSDNGRKKGVVPTENSSVVSSMPQTSHATSRSTDVVVTDVLICESSPEKNTTTKDASDCVVRSPATRESQGAADGVGTEQIQVANRALTESNHQPPDVTCGMDDTDTTDSSLPSNNKQPSAYIAGSEHTSTGNSIDSDAEQSLTSGSDARQAHAADTVLANSGSSALKPSTHTSNKPGSVPENDKESSGQLPASKSSNVDVESSRKEMQNLLSSKKKQNIVVSIVDHTSHDHRDELLVPFQPGTTKTDQNGDHLSAGSSVPPADEDELAGDVTEVTSPANTSSSASQVVVPTTANKSKSDTIHVVLEVIKPNAAATTNNQTSPFATSPCESSSLHQPKVSSSNAHCTNTSSLKATCSEGTTSSTRAQFSFPITKPSSESPSTTLASTTSSPCTTSAKNQSPVTSQGHSRSSIPPLNSCGVGSAAGKEVICLGETNGRQVTLPGRLVPTSAPTKPMIIEEGTSDQVLVIDNKVPDIVSPGNKRNGKESPGLGLCISNVRSNVAFDEHLGQEDRDCYISAETIRPAIKQEKVDSDYDKAALPSKQSNQELHKNARLKPMVMSGTNQGPRVIRVFPLSSFQRQLSTTPQGMNFRLQLISSSTATSGMTAASLQRPPRTTSGMAGNSSQSVRSILRSSRRKDTLSLPGMSDKELSPVRMRPDMPLMETSRLKPYLAPTPPPELDLQVKHYNCTQCGDTFLNARSLQDHLNRRSLKLSFLCSHCKGLQVVHNLCQLKKHIRLHKPPLGLNMDICKYVKNLFSLPLSEAQFTEHPALKVSAPNQTPVPISVTTTNQSDQPVKESSDSIINTDLSAVFSALYHGSVPDFIWNRNGNDPGTHAHQKDTSLDDSESCLMIRTQQRLQSAGVPYQCQVCKVWSSTNDHFTSDLDVVDIDSIEECKVCCAILPTPCMRVVHGTLHTSVGPSLCPECGIILTGDRFLDQIHMEMRCLTGMRCYLFCCDKCGSGVTGTHLFAQHLQLAHGTAYACDECGRKTKYFHNLQRHWKAKHPNVTYKESEKEKYLSFQCTMCVCSFPTMKLVIDHMCTAHKQNLLTKGKFVYKCPVGLCDEMYSQKRLLDSHLNQNHPLEKITAIRRNKCTVCFNEFTSSTELDAHLREKTFCLQRITHGIWKKLLHKMSVIEASKIIPDAIADDKSRGNSKNLSSKSAEKLDENENSPANESQKQTHKNNKISGNKSPEKPCAKGSNGGEGETLMVNLDKETIETVYPSVDVNPTNLGNDISVKEEPSDGETVNRCLPCRLNFSSHSDYGQHLSSAHGIELPALSGTEQQESCSLPPQQSDVCFKCTACEQAISGVDVYEKHLQSQHGLYLSRTMVLQHRVATSPAKTSDTSTGQIGKQAKKRPTEDKEGTSDPKKVKLNRTRQVEVELPRPYSCSHCDNSYTTARLRDRHEQLKHSVAPRFPCHLCGLTYPDILTLQEHQANQHQGQVAAAGFSCVLCRQNGETKSYSKQVWLVRHLISTHKLDRTKLTAARVWELTVSPEGNTQDNKPDTSAIKRLKVQGEIDFQCCRCDFKASTREEFSSHISCHLSNSEAQQCQECGMCFSTKPSLKRHLMMVHKIRDFTTYRTETGFDINKPVHTDINRAFYQASEAFRSHRSPVQSPVKQAQESNPLECQVCYKVFPDTNALSKHGRTHGMAFIRSKRSQTART